MKSYETPRVLADEELAEGVFLASGSAGATFARESDDGNGVFYTVQIPPQFQGKESKVKASFHLSDPATYADARDNPAWGDGHWTDNNYTFVAYGTNLSAETYRFAFVPYTVTLQSIDLELTD